MAEREEQIEEAERIKQEWQDLTDSIVLGLFNLMDPEAFRQTQQEHSENKTS